MAQTTKTVAATAATATTASTPPAAAESAPPEARKRQRRRTIDGTVSGTLRPVYPISAILASATPEEVTRARMLVSELLGYWLGHESKASLARRLSVPQVRVWQMGQRALAGMVAAMLTPPSGPRGPTGAMPRVSPETIALRKRVQELERETGVQRRLIELLRALPSQDRRECAKETSDVAKSGTSRPRARRGEEPALGLKVPRGGPGPGPEPTPAAG